MFNRSALSLVALISLLAAAFLAIRGIVNQIALAEWWMPLLLFVVGIGALAWNWMSSNSGSQLPEKHLDEPTTQVTTPVVHIPPPPSVSITDVAVTDAVDLPNKPRETTEMLPQVELSAEEMAIFKPTTPHVTANLDEGTIEEAVRRAAERKAESEKDETVPMRPGSAEPAADETHPRRPEKMIVPAGFSAEEMAIQKPITPHATESFDDAAIDEAITKAKARARTQKSTDITTAEEMASQKPETSDSTGRISRDLLPPTSTREMASRKPPTEVSTHEMESTIEVEVSEDASPLVDDKSGVVDMPAPSTEMMEVQSAPKEPTRRKSETIEVASDDEAVNHDDLQRIEGIGPKIAEMLIAAGISTYSRLATTPEEELREIMERANYRLAPTLTTWAEQAALAARGDWDTLKAYQDEMGKRD